MLKMCADFLYCEFDKCRCNTVKFFFKSIFLIFPGVGNYKNKRE